MKNVIFTLSIFTFFTSALMAQIVVDFEDATVGDTSFMAGGVEWKLTEDFLISEFENFSCSMTSDLNRYIDSGYEDGGSEEIVGSIAPIAPDVTFQMATSASQCIWIGNADGEFTSTGTIKFTGFKPDNTTVEESFEVTTTSLSNLVSVDLTEATWNAVDLAVLQVEITDTQDSTDYVAIDNLTFETITLPTSIQSIDETDIKLFPNPTTGMFSLQNVEADQVSIFNHLGQEIRTEMNPGNSINITNLPLGIYFLKIREKDQLYIAKVFKE